MARKEKPAGAAKASLNLPQERLKFNCLARHLAASKAALPKPAYWKRQVYAIHAGSGSGAGAFNSAVSHPIRTLRTRQLTVNKDAICGNVTTLLQAAAQWGTSARATQGMHVDCVQLRCTNVRHWSLDGGAHVCISVKQKGRRTGGSR